MGAAMKPKIGEPVLVRWVDAHTTSGWRPIETLKASAAEAVIAESKGDYLGVVGKGAERGLLLLMTRQVKPDDKDGTESLTIPLSSVVSIHPLRKGKAYSKPR